MKTRLFGWDAAEATSQGLAACVTALLAALLLTHLPNPTPPLAEAPKPTVVALSMVEEPPPPPAVPPPAPEPPPPPPPPRVTPSPLPPPPPPRRIVRPRRPPTPHRVVAQEPPPAPVTPPKTENFARTPQQAPENHSAEAAYIGRLHAIVARNTAPPSSAEYRLTYPSGEVQIGFTLSRSGAVSDVHILRPSGSALLDRQALSIVAGQHYPPIPDDVYPGANTHAFSVPVSFTYNGGGDDGL